MNQAIGRNRVGGATRRPAAPLETRQEFALAPCAAAGVGRLQRWRGMRFVIPILTVLLLTGCSDVATT